MANKVKLNIEILKKPVITEKMTQIGEKFNRYAFVVDRKASKKDIKKAVEEMYNVNVIKVNTMIVPGKTRVRYTKSGFNRGQTSAYKKAIVTLAEGQEIDFYSNV